MLWKRQTASLCLAVVETGLERCMGGELDRIQRVHVAAEPVPQGLRHGHRVSRPIANSDRGKRTEGAARVECDSPPREL